MADVTVGADRVEAAIRVAVEPILAGIDLASVEDTDESPLSGLNDRLRALPPEALEAALREAWPSIAARITMRSGEATLDPVLSAVTVPPVGDVELRRDSTLTVTADLPPGDAPVVLGWDGALGGLVVRQVGEGTDYASFLAAGALTEPMPRMAGPGLGPVAAFVAGILHVLPRVPEHALFVVALALASAGWRPLLWQGVAFAVGQTVMLLLAGTGAVPLPGPLTLGAMLALSVMAMAGWAWWKGPAETLDAPRAAGLAGLGLVHGMGLAAGTVATGATGIAALLAFNVGAELAMIAVAGAVLGLLIVPFGQRGWYRRTVVGPEAALVGILGLILLLT